MAYSLFHLLLAVLLVIHNTEAFQQTKFSQKFKSLFRFQPIASTNVVNTVLTNNQKKSFVQDELRAYAMKLHTRDQSPREGQQKAQTPFTQWEVKRQDYLHFLVDSLHVYETFDKLIHDNAVYSKLRNTGLERAEALKTDIKWMTTQYDSTLAIPEVGKGGKEYAALLTQLATTSVPRFMCHFYNHYFAHTAGGRMIGKKMAEKLLEDKVLKFYEWDGDVKALLDAVRQTMDEMADGWTAEERQACLEETAATFHAGGSLMVYMRPPTPMDGAAAGGGSGHGH